MCGLDPVAGRAIGELSKGYRQRVGLAQAIIHRPDVLILDEPTSGLDPNQIAEIRDVIREIGREKSVLLSTHVMQEIEALCDRIIVIASGQIVADGTVGELYAKHPEAGGLEELFRMLTSDYKPSKPAPKPKRDTTEPADPKRFMPTGERATVSDAAEPPSDTEPEDATTDDDAEES